MVGGQAGNNVRYTVVVGEALGLWEQVSLWSLGKLSHPAAGKDLTSDVWVAAQAVGVEWDGGPDIRSQDPVPGTDGTGGADGF
jgi:hypothetical protein